MLLKSNKISVGDTFNTNEGGACKVIEYINSRKVVIEHLDRYAHRATVQAYNLRRGQVKNPFNPSVYGVGFIGCGSHSPSVSCVDQPAYVSWHGIMQRCYRPTEHDRSPTYAGRTVHPDWHNFQVFAEWFYAQPNSQTKGFDLDKDLIVFGSKIYSEETCSFVPHHINSLLIDCGASRGNWPQGVTLDKRCGTFISQIKIKGVHTNLGRYSCPQAAHRRYVEVKAEYVRAMAEEYKPLLHPKVYHNLKSWNLK